MIHQDLIPLVFELAIFYNSQILPPSVREGNFSSIHGKIGLRFSYINVQVVNGLQHTFAHYTCTITDIIK